MSKVGRLRFNFCGGRSPREVGRDNCDPEKIFLERVETVSRDVSVSDNNNNDDSISDDGDGSVSDNNNNKDDGDGDDDDRDDDNDDATRCDVMRYCTTAAST